MKSDRLLHALRQIDPLWTLSELAEAELQGRLSAELVASIEQAHPDYVEIRDGVRRALADEPLGSAQARDFVRGVLEPEQVHAVAARVERGEPGVLEPLRGAMAGAADLWGELLGVVQGDEPPVHQLRRALAIARLAGEAGLLEAADAVQIALRVGGHEQAGGEHIEFPQGTQIRLDQPLLVYLGAVPGVHEWLGHRVHLRFGDGGRAHGVGRVLEQGVVRLEPGGMLLELATLLPQGQLDLAQLAGGPVGRALRIVLDVEP